MKIKEHYKYCCHSEVKHNFNFKFSTKIFNSQFPDDFRGAVKYKTKDGSRGTEEEQRQQLYNIKNNQQRCQKSEFK